MKRNFSADHSDQLLISDFTYIQTNSGWVYHSFIIDVFSRAVVGWKTSTLMNTDMVLNVLEQAFNAQAIPKNMIHHYMRALLRKRHTISFHSLYQRLEAANLPASVGITGDSYDNALPKTLNGLYKTEIIEYLEAD